MWMKTVERSIRTTAELGTNFMRYILLLLVLCWTARAANPSFADFSTQFSTNGNKVSIKSGAVVTNLHDTGTLTANSATVSNAISTATLLATANVTFSQNARPSAVWIDTGAGAGLGSWTTNLPVGDLAGVLAHQPRRSGVVTALGRRQQAAPSAAPAQPARFLFGRVQQTWPIVR